MRLTARHAVAVCTGSEAAMPPVDGLGDDRRLDTPGGHQRQGGARPAADRRRRLVGCEMATAWQALGSQVTLFQRGERLLPAWSRSPARRSPRRCGSAGSRCGSRATSPPPAATAREVVADHDARRAPRRRVLVAVGRRARTRDIGLDTVGLEPGQLPRRRRHAARGRTAVAVRRWVTSTACASSRTWASTRRGRRGGHRGARDRPGASRPPTGRRSWRPPTTYATPQVVFTDPAGRQRRAHRRRGRAGRAPHRVVDRPRSRSRARACSPTTTTGRRSMVVDTEREVLLGVTFVGPAVAELLHAATIAVVGRGADRQAVARRAGVPDDERDLAAPAGGLPGVSGCSA